MPISAGGQPIRVDVIGPLRVSVGPAILEILSERQRCLLAALVLESPQVVSRDRLIDVLWPTRQPASATHALRVHVSELRKRFRAACSTEPLVTIGDGYMLDTSVVQTDVSAVDLLVGEARAAQVAGDAAGSLEASEAALELWRGLPYPDLDDDDRSHAARGRLAELRTQLVDESIEARLVLGRYSEVIVELEQTVRADPLRERSCRQLMVALYRSGRQREALSRYEHARTALREELGVEPGPMLHETYLAILEHDPMLTQSLSVRSSQALSDRTFVGRQRELRELGPIVGRDQPGSIVLLSGPPGIGKTRTADELAAVSGRAVLRGRCPEGAGAPPLWPIAEAVRPLGALAIELLAERCDPLALAPLVAAVADEPPDDAPSELSAFRLSSAVVSLLHLVASREPTLLILDDVQWADATTLGVLTRLTETMDSSGLVIAVTYRDAPADLGPPFGPALAGLARAIRVRTCVLGPLDQHAVGNYVRSQIPDVTADVVNTLVERIEGHALVMAELVALIRDRGRDSLETIPTGLAQVLSSRLNGVGDSLGVLARAAVVGRSFPVDLLARVGDVGTDELLRAIEAAHRAGLIDLDDDGGGRFVHALIAEAAAATLDDGTRRMLHLRVAEAWERRVDRPTVLRVTEIARHRVAALPLGDPVAAAVACVHAGTEAMGANAYEDAIHAFVGAQRACRFTDGLRDRSSTLVDALIGEGECWMVIGETDRARPLLLDALEVSRRSQDPQRFALAVRVLATARSTSAGGLDDGVVTLLDEAAEMLAGVDSWLLVQLLTDRALVRYRTSERLAGVAMAEEALEVARRLNDPMAISFALTGLHGAVLGPDSVEQRLELVEEAIEQAKTAGVEWHQSMALSFRAMARWELGDLDDARRDIDQCAHLADRAGRTRFRWIAQSWRSLHQLFTGNELAAESGFAEALALWGPRSNTDAFMCFSAQQLNLALLRGRGGDLVELLRSAATDDPEPLVWAAFLSYPMVQGGFADEASACLETLMGHGLDKLERTATWPVAVSMLAEAAAALEHREVAAALLPLMEPFAGRYVLLNVFGGGGFCWGSFDHQIGIVRGATGDRRGARASLDRAISAQERVGASPFVERSQRARMELG